MISNTCSPSNSSKQVQIYCIKKQLNSSFTQTESSTKPFIFSPLWKQKLDEFFLDNNSKKKEKCSLTSSEVNSNFKHNQINPIFQSLQNKSPINKQKIVFYMNSNTKKKKRGKKYHIFDFATKKKILKEMEYKTISEVEKKYKVPRRTLTRWRSNGIKRKKGSGRKFADPNLEKKIMEWYSFQDPLKITSSIFMRKARELSISKTFKASQGWLMRIKAKYDLHLKKN